MTSDILLRIESIERACTACYALQDNAEGFLARCASASSTYGTASIARATV